MKQLFFAFLLFVSVSVCAQGGTYLPVVTASVTTINPIAQVAQYIQADSVVIIYGTVFLNGFPVAGVPVTLHVSVPVPSNFTVPPSMVRGSGDVLQSGAPSVRAQVTSNFIDVIVKYTPSVSAPANLNYNFSYLIRP